MMRYYDKDASPLRYACLWKKMFAVSVVLFAITLFVVIISKLIGEIIIISPSMKMMLIRFRLFLNMISIFFFIFGLIILLISFGLRMRQSEEEQLIELFRKRIFLSEYGNPLGLRDGELLPRVLCDKTENGVFQISISTSAFAVEDIANISSALSSALNINKWKQYAVTKTIEDIAFNFVTFQIEDVSIHKEYIFDSINEMHSDYPYVIPIQQGVHIDLRSSGSILCAGKTRSGKTTGIIAILLYVLNKGRDEFDSQVCIIDPKQAELSMLPYVNSLDSDGEAKQIMSAVRGFADSIVSRQKELNNRSQEKGDVLKWWDCNMHPSFLFIDEYVALRSLFPKKADKENPKYSLAEFDSLLKRIVTMGASAGCFVIISIAEASVEEGGLPSMLKNALTTKFLFKPTKQEARLIWDSEKMQNLSVNRLYSSGDCWFSSTDGVNDIPSFVHFPVMQFSVYKELGELLSRYYSL